MGSQAGKLPLTSELVVNHTPDGDGELIVQAKDLVDEVLLDGKRRMHKGLFTYIRGVFVASELQESCADKREEIVLLGHFSALQEVLYDIILPLDELTHTRTQVKDVPRIGR